MMFQVRNLRLAILAVLLIAVVTMSGCMVQQRESAHPEQPMPDAWSTHPDSVDLSDAELAQWWREFQDPALDQLVTMALASNIDLASATARVREARAQRKVSHAQLWPNLYVAGSGSRTTSSQAVGTGDTNELFTAGLEVGWEPDVFGYRRLGLEAADAEVAASEEALHNARVSLLAELAANYVDLRTAEARLDIVRSTLAARMATYELTQWRLQAGLVSELDVTQALTELESARSAIPALRTAVTEARNRLGVLIVATPDQLEATLTIASGIPVGSRTPSPGIPAELLRRRPDVRAAERTFAAQAARVAQARSERYPSFSLSGLIGVEALSFGALNDDGASRRTLLGNVTAPIFDAGRIAGNVELQDARLDQARLARIIREG
jgi:NodT family efflux transporter outer membrane factor (OMF) lipoprotein